MVRHCAVLLVFLVSSALVTAHIKQHRILIKTPSNCSNGTEESEDSDFPSDLFSDESRRHGAIILHFLGSLYCFVLIALVCNDYFLPSVDCICQDLALSKDVAGATFMALATSAPELFVNIIGTFLTESDLGVGTVVGSDVFNTLGVAACGGLAAYKAIQLEIWPLARDCSIFMAVVALLGLILWDEKVEWYEALLLILLYILYCTFLFTQKKLHRAAKSLLNSTKSFSSQLSVEVVETKTGPDMDCGTYSPYFHHGEPIGYTDSRRNSSIDYRRSSKTVDLMTVSAMINGKLAPPPSQGGLVLKSLNINKELDNDPVEDEVGCVLCSVPESWSSRCLWLLVYPLSLCLYLTVPDCRRVRYLYPLTFIMCTVWIGLSSYFVSWMMTTIGQTFGISDSVMGLTLVAIGGSMPEASTSIINARKGIGSMSISNALGGNTLDILLSLGLPWFIKTQLPASMEGGPVIIRSAGLVYNNAAQLACTAALFIVAACNKFRMDRKLGIACLLLYLAFIAFIVLMELDVFHLRRKPEQEPCSSP